MSDPDAHTLVLPGENEENSIFVAGSSSEYVSEGLVRRTLRAMETDSDSRPPLRVVATNNIFGPTRYGESGGCITPERCRNSHLFVRNSWRDTGDAVEDLSGRAASPHWRRLSSAAGLRVLGRTVSLGEAPLLRITECIEEVEHLFRKSIMEASKGTRSTLEDLCEPSVVNMVSGLAEWAVMDCGISSNGKEYLKLVKEDTLDAENKPPFLLCVNLAKVMPPKMANLFMKEAISRFCSSNTIGDRHNENHMGNFALMFNAFDVDVLFDVLLRLDPLIDDGLDTLVVEYLRFPHAGLTAGCYEGGVRVMDDPITCAELFNRCMNLHSNFQSRSLIPSLLLERMVNSDGPVVGSFLLAATRKFNFDLVHMAVTRGRICIDNCSLQPVTNDSFLCFLRHLPVQQFRIILSSWLPTSYAVNHAHLTLKYLANKLTCGWYIPYIYDSTPPAQYSFDQDVWLLLLEEIKQDLLTIEMLIATVRCNYMEAFNKMIDLSNFPAAGLKMLVKYLIERNEVKYLKYTLKKYPWLARTYITKDGGLVHYAIKRELGRFAGLISIREIRGNLELPNQNGLTPLLFACGQARSKYVKALIKAGANALYMTRGRETIFHLLCRNSYINHNVLSFIHNFKSERQLPDIEIRRSKDNTTALQLLVMEKLTDHFFLPEGIVSVGTLLMNKFKASITSLFSTYSKLNTADILVLYNNRKLLDEKLFECSVTRILHAYIDDTLESPLKKASWPLFHSGNLSIVGQKVESARSFNKSTALQFLKLLNSTQEYSSNATLNEVLKIHSDPACPICLDSITAEHYRTSCGHHFHSNCLDLWLAHSLESRCPLCKTPNQPRIPLKIIESDFIPNRPPSSLLNERPLIDPPTISVNEMKKRPMERQPDWMHTPYTKLISPCSEDPVYETMEFRINGNWVSEADLYRE